MSNTIFIARPHTFIVSVMKPFLEECGYDTSKLEHISSLPTLSTAANQLGRQEIFVFQQGRPDIARAPRDCHTPGPAPFPIGESLMKRLVLVGGGHAHLSALRAIAQKRTPGMDVTLITPSAHQNYSGMLPGWIAGHYSEAECRVDLRPLV